MPGVSLRPQSIPDAPLYSPGRDFAYNYPAMVQSISRAFNSDYWPVVKKSLEKLLNIDADTAWEALLEANELFIRFLNISCEDPEEKVEDVLKRSGFSELDPETQLCYIAMLGQVVVGQLFVGLRDTTLLGQSRLDVVELLRFGAVARRVANDLPPDGKQEQQDAEDSIDRGIHNLMAVHGLSRSAIRKMVDDKLAQDVYPLPKAMS